MRDAAKRALGTLTPAGKPESDAEARGLMLSSRTEAGHALPEYYLIYFLLVDLLDFPHIGRGEKTAWTVPVRINERLYGIEHAKFGVGVFAPTLDPSATRSGKPSDQAESDAKEIVALMRRAVIAAEPYFEWRAENAAKGINLNVTNRSNWLFGRFAYFRDQYHSLQAAHEKAQSDRKAELERKRAEEGRISLSEAFIFGAGGSVRSEDAEWCGQAAIDAFFSWTEHVFIHVGILQGRVGTGEEVASLADSDWKSKFKAALDLADATTKKHYDALVQLRAQVRNFMAHGAFGKRGEAFKFHSGAGAVPVLLTGRQRHKFAFTGRPAFSEGEALHQIEKFIEHLWTGARLPAKLYIESDIPTILSYVADGTYAKAMASESEMNSFLEQLHYQFDAATNMDW